MTTAKHRTAIPVTLSVDLWWTGILSTDKCSCMHPAHEHSIKVRRGVVKQIRCEANCPCRTWDDGWRQGKRA
jgi:hypothetical protein